MNKRYIQTKKQIVSTPPQNLSDARKKPTKP